MSTTIEVYENAEIAFRGDGWVNATQMAKPFKKSPKDFLRTGAAKSFLTALEGNLGVGQKCLTVQQGGVCQGTWMHPDLALEFARWLAPEFAIWCNRTVRRLLSGGPAAGDAELVVKLLERLVDQQERMIGLHEQLKARVDRMELTPAAGDAAAPQLAPLEAKIGAVLEVCLRPGVEFGCVKSRGIAEQAVRVGGFEVQLRDWPSSNAVSRLMLTFLQYENRWIQTSESRQVWVRFQKHSKNRHRLYLIWVRRGQKQAEG